jgi:hypothetical protein
MSERDVVEFIIVPPLNKLTAVGAARERMVHYLAGKFPGYRFIIPKMVPVDGDEDEFAVLPLMNFAGDDGNSYMCNPPKPWLMAEIAQACKEFDLDGLRHFAA